MGAAGHQQRPPTGGGRNQLVNTASRLRFRPASPGLSREAPGLSVTRGGRATKPTGAGWGSAPTCAGWTAAGQGSLPASWIPLSDRSASDANGLPKGSQTRRGTSFFTTRTRVGRTHHDPSPGVFVVGRRGFSASSSPGGVVEEIDHGTMSVDDGGDRGRAHAPSRRGVDSPAGFAVAGAGRARCFGRRPQVAQRHSRSTGP